MLPNLKEQFESAIESADARLEDDHVIAPLGKRWKGLGTHDFPLIMEETWSDMYRSAIKQIEIGLDDCSPECGRCFPFQGKQSKVSTNDSYWIASTYSMLSGAGHESTLKVATNNTDAAVMLGTMIASICNIHHPESSCPDPDCEIDSAIRVGLTLEQYPEWKYVKDHSADESSLRALQIVEDMNGSVDRVVVQIGVMVASIDRLSGEQFTSLAPIMEILEILSKHEEN